MYLSSSYLIHHVRFQNKYSETVQGEEKLKSEERKQSSKTGSDITQLLALTEKQFKISV